MDDPSQDGRASFEQQAARGTSGGTAGEVWFFLRRTRNWWMLPIILALLAVGGLLVLSGTAVGPMIYTLF